MPKLPNGLLLLALLALPSQAERLFDVELVIFTRADHSQEAWPKKAKSEGNRDLLLTQALAEICPAPCPVLPARLDADVLAAAPAVAGQDGERLAAALPRLLGADQLALAAEAKKVASLPGGRVLLHTGWRMAPRAPRYSTPFAVEAGRDLGPYLLLEPQPEQLAAEEAALAGADETVVAPAVATALEESQPVEILGEEQWQEITPVAPPVQRELTGHIKVSLDHYLLVDMELDRFEVQGEGLPLQVKRLDQKRRLRSGELHYFDHPALGVLMQIRPVADAQ
ncbi:CsiV family protein [Gallaecimonas sp. GXIMD4217]|uniref:CsiV family protein n=1 Tax=Gallaecimonas sp. GXIMD4217 TaxID=3131927 RepID=UPI00311B41E0